MMNSQDNHNEDIERLFEKYLIINKKSGIPVTVEELEIFIVELKAATAT